MLSAYSFALFMKAHMPASSRITKFTYNKLSRILRCSPTTTKKYVKILLNLGFISFEGKDNKTLVLKRLSSGTRHRNVNVENYCFDTFKDARRSFQALIFMLRQSHREFIEYSIRVATSPEVGEDCRKARRLCKKYAWQNPKDAQYEFREWGFSYKKIASYMSCCKRTAVRVVKYAVEKKWVEKHNRYQQVFLPGVWYRPVPGFTFTTKNNGYKILANSYTILEEGVRSLYAHTCTYARTDAPVRACARVHARGMA